MTICKICGSESNEFAIATILNRHSVQYYQCSHCGFVQTEEPYWLAEAYRQAIARSDVGLVYRNTIASRLTQIVISNFFDGDCTFLDFGGGYGLFVRMMRDLGYNFHWHDQYCQNIFAQGFEASNRTSKNYELVTAFEVLEHLVNPIEEIAGILSFSKNFLLSTSLLPDNNPKPDDWWYYVLDEGQHIALYSLESLKIIARKFNLYLYSDLQSWHLFTQRPLPENVFDNLDYFERQVEKKPSLIQADYKEITGKLFFEGKDPSFDSRKNSEEEVPNFRQHPLKIGIDGVFFQFYKTGITRLWQSLLAAWTKDGFADYIVVLDRAGTMPKIEGITYLNIPAFDYNNVVQDRHLLDEICSQNQISLFISTYYTFPSVIPSVVPIYDMIPEVGRWDLSSPMWQEKHRAIAAASAYIAISHNTARDLMGFFPDIAPQRVTVAHCGVDDRFHPASEDAIHQFKYKYGIDKPYFLLVGIGEGYKNTKLFLKAFQTLANRSRFDIVCTTGSASNFKPEWRDYTQGSTVHLLYLPDGELASAYSGAIALVFPSQYEGFGLPVVEAMACGCPVITCPQGSIPEVAGEAAVYVDSQDVDRLARALEELQKPEIRQRMIVAGLERVQSFSWETMAKEVSQSLVKNSLEALGLRAVNFIVFPNWTVGEETLAQGLGQLLAVLNSHPDRLAISLLIYTGDLDLETINLWFSELALNLMLETSLEIGEDISIVPTGQLAVPQWHYLLRRIQAKIDFHAEDLTILEQLDIQPLKSLSLRDLENFKAVPEENGQREID